MANAHISRKLLVLTKYELFSTLGTRKEKETKRRSKTQTGGGKGKGFHYC